MNKRQIAALVNDLSTKKIVTSDCYYCGMPATGVDHVVPLSILYTLIDIKEKGLLRNRITIVSCCNECNTLLGTSYQETLKQRKTYLKRKLKKKYRKVFSTVEFTKSELKQFGPTLRQYIKSNIAKKKWISVRLKW
jgi:hypothetical protein